MRNYENINIDLLHVLLKYLDLDLEDPLCTYTFNQDTGLFTVGDDLHAAVYEILDFLETQTNANGFVVEISLPQERKEKVREFLEKLENKGYQFVRDIFILSHPVDPEKVKYLVENFDPVKIGKIKARKYRYRNRLYLVLLDGNHRYHAIMKRLSSEVRYWYSYDEEEIQILNNLIEIEEDININEKEMLFLEIILKYLSSQYGNYWREEIRKFLEEKRISEVEFINFYITKVVSDQTEGWGFLFNGVMRIIDDRVYEVEGIVDARYINNYNSKQFYLDRLYNPPQYIKVRIENRSVILEEMIGEKEIEKVWKSITHLFEKENYSNYISITAPDNHESFIQGMIQLPCIYIDETEYYSCWI